MMTIIISHVLIFALGLLSKTAEEETVVVRRLRDK